MASTTASSSGAGSYATSSLKQEQELATVVDWTPAELVARQERLATWALERWKITPISADITTADDDPTDIIEDVDPMLGDNGDAADAEPEPDLTD
jgi:hypothetical protein